MARTFQRIAALSKKIYQISPLNLTRSLQLCGNYFSWWNQLRKDSKICLRYGPLWWFLPIFTIIQQRNSKWVNNILRPNLGKRNSVGMPNVQQNAYHNAIKLAELFQYCSKLLFFNCFFHTHYTPHWCDCRNIFNVPYTKSNVLTSDGAALDSKFLSLFFDLDQL